MSIYETLSHRTQYPSAFTFGDYVGICSMSGGDQNPRSADSQKIDFEEYGRCVRFTVTFQTSYLREVRHAIRRVLTSWSRCCKRFLEKIFFDDEIREKHVFGFVFRPPWKIFSKVTENKLWNRVSRSMLYTGNKKKVSKVAAFGVVWSKIRSVKNSKFIFLVLYCIPIDAPRQAEQLLCWTFE